MTTENQHQPSVVCFGEVLWDVFPTVRKPGGAPMNVAYNLRQLGVNCSMISRLGDDEDGKGLLQQFADWNFPATYIGIDCKYPTSTVDLVADEHNDYTYTIHEGVAWDHIPVDAANAALVSNADAFVFGSLAMRDTETYHTLLQLMDLARVKVLDINIRMPFFSIDKIREILPKIDILKLNKAELNQVIEALGADIEADEDLRVRYLQDTYGIAEVLLTKGSKGAIYYCGAESFFQPAYHITVKDTVGSGDAFLAGFLSKRFSGTPAVSKSSYVDFAAAIGAFMTTKDGACPSYTIDEVIAFIQEHRQPAL
ncbi:carbohydrate kinase family protein [Pedobacter sp. AW31-3R]|uniref:carbohydrate kinase family protein n=1 Tax=Pedobacter sp. AW31-3R TaxID=3445781 RepID=UPI003F9F7214